MQRSMGLGEYKSIWEGVDDPLLRELIGQELRKNHRRPIKDIKRAAARRYWLLILRWTLEDLGIWVPIFGALILGMFLILIAMA